MSVTAAIEGDPRAIATIAQSLIYELSDGNSRYPCPAVLLGALTVVTEAFEDYSPQETDKFYTFCTRMCRQHPEVLRALVRFLLTPRDTAARRELCSHECSCALGPADKIRHDLHTIDYRPFELVGFAVKTRMTRFLFSAMQIVSSCYTQVLFRGAHKTLKASARKARAGRDVWPANVHDLVPHGILTSVSILDAWSDVASGPAAILLKWTTGMWGLAAYPVFPSIILRVILPGVFLSALQRVLSACPPDASDYRHLQNFIYLEIFLDRLEPSGVVAALLRPHRDAQWMCKLLAALASAASRIQSLQRQFPNSEEPPDDIYLSCANCATRLHALLAIPLPADTSPDFPTIRDRHLKEMNDPTALLWSLLIMHGQYSVLSCNNPTCSRTSITEGCRIARCAGCLCVYYCW